MKRTFVLFIILFGIQQAYTQPVVLKEVLKPNRDKLYRNIIRNAINANLLMPLTDSTEENWEEAFRAMEVTRYRSPWADNKVVFAFDNMQNRSADFQRAVLEFGYSIHPKYYYRQVRSLLTQTADAKIFSMCAEYIMQTDQAGIMKDSLLTWLQQRLEADNKNPFLLQLKYRLEESGKPLKVPPVQAFLQKNYLPGHVLLISFQRKNRNYPGLVMVRDASGNFLKDENGNYFSLTQLARSMNNLPGYLTNGNTPEGIFRMWGFDHSKSTFIGPSTNIQLTMPFEKTPAFFYNNASISDTSWRIEAYKRLLPDSFKNYFPAYQSFYAGKAGRTEIIAHGTTIDPSWYRGQQYYPISPTQGCLCTKEIWSSTTGMLEDSDQERLAAAVSKAGGPNGYAIVINIDEKEAPVVIDDIIPFLLLAGQQ